MLYYAFLAILTFTQPIPMTPMRIKIVAIVDTLGPYRETKECEKRLEKMEENAAKLVQEFSVLERGCNTLEYWKERFGFNPWETSGEKI